MKERNKILSELGSGGYGTVFRALDTKLNREVAIKRLKPESDSSESELNDRLQEEAKVLAALRHPNIVTIFDIQQNGNSAEIIMELIEGKTLSELVDHHVLQPSDFIYISTQILSALATAHENNVLHCDIKPSNVMLSLTSQKSYEVKLLDFGMSPTALISKNNSPQIMGSIYFMAPEQFDKQTPRPETDIYSLGCLFYYMLTGFLPFAGDTTIQVMASHMSGNYQPLSTLVPSYPKPLIEWIEKHLNKNATERYSTVRESLETLLFIDFESNLMKHLPHLI